MKVLCFAGSTGASHQVAYHVLVDKIEGIEPPLAHVVPEGAGHIVLPVISIIALALTFQISGKNFDTYNKSNTYMNSTIVEYIEGIEVIKWLSSTWITMKLAFALFPTTLLGTLPASLFLASKGIITAPQAALAVMLSISMVGSLAKLEVFANEIKQMQMVVDELESLLSIKSLPEPENRANVTSTDVELHQVHFSYSGNAEDEVLHGIDLKLPQGSFTALVGPSGGGNSKDMPISQISEKVSFVSQDNFLFRCSLLENIRLGNPSATDEEVKAAARAAQILVVDDGRIAECGTHKELIKQNGKYRQFVSIREKAEGWKIS